MTLWTCGCCHRDTDCPLRRGWCKGCYARWLRLGKPDVLPPPTLRLFSVPPWPGVCRTRRMGEWRFLRSQGLTTDEELAARLGCSVRTIKRYKAIERVYGIVEEAA
jgi:hypothetical protein